MQGQLRIIQCNRHDCLYLLRLYVELNAEKRKHQGDSRSAHEIGREYYSFFTADVQDALESIQGREDRIEAREQLCSIFQVI